MDQSDPAPSPSGIAAVGGATTLWVPSPMPLDMVQARARQLGVSLLRRLELILTSGLDLSLTTLVIVNARPLRTRADPIAIMTEIEAWMKDRASLVPLVHGAALVVHANTTEAGLSTLYQELCDHLCHSHGLSAQALPDVLPLKALEALAPGGRRARDGGATGDADSGVSDLAALAAAQAQMPLWFTDMLREQSTQGEFNLVMAGDDGTTGGHLVMAAPAADLATWVADAPTVAEMMRRLRPGEQVLSMIERPSLPNLPDIPSGRVIGCFHPLLQVRRNRFAAFRVDCRLMDDDGDSGLHGSDADPRLFAAVDYKLLALCLHYLLLWAQSEQRSAPLMVPVHWQTATGKGEQNAFLELLNAVPEHVREHLMWEVIGAGEGRSRDGAIAAVTRLKSTGGKVGLRLPLEATNHFDYSRAGAWAFSVDLERGLTSKDIAKGRMEGFAKRSRDAGMKLLIFGVQSPATLEQVRQVRPDFIGGAAVHLPVPQPVTAAPPP